MEIPAFPSLYNPAIELTPFQYTDAMQPAGYYIPLDGPHNVFLFTFYWTVAFQTPIFAACAVWACMCLTTKKEMKGNQMEMVELRAGRQRPSKNRSARVAFSAIILGTFLALSLMGTLVSSAFTSLLLFGLFKAGGFFMSTWIPFLGALFSVGVGTLRCGTTFFLVYSWTNGRSVWPSVIEII
jgi:hypothetical protein